MEYLIISVPLENENLTFDSVYDKLYTKHKLCDVVKFSVPQELKVGTLDELMNLSEKLNKLDVVADSVTRKLVNYMGEIMEDEKSKLSSHLTINDETVGQFALHYRWDEAKIPVKESMNTIYSILSKRISDIEDNLKAKSHSYNQIKVNLQTLERRENSSLLNRSLSNLVAKEHFVLDSEYLVTLAVVVAKSNYTQWLANYSTLTEFVVPNSSELIYHDAEHGLWTVTLFKKVAAAFAVIAKEKKFFVRDFVYDEIEIEKSKNEMSNTMEEKKTELKAMLRWLKTHFKEAVIYMIHVKSLRIYVESVLRYGLPVKFQSILVAPSRKNHKAIREKLGKMFNHLDNESIFGGSDKSCNEDSLIADKLGESEYFPYVCCQLETNFAK